MLDSIYIGLTGLTSFSQGLNNISNNVTNLNTAGYKRGELGFTDLYYRYELASDGDRSAYAQGSGVSSGQSSTVFKQGDFRQTGNDLDAAIDGNGFFVLLEDGKQYYSRAGQFQIDDKGYLVSRDDGAKVAVLEGGQLRDVSIDGVRTSAPKATTTVKPTDILSTNDPTFDLNNVTVIDSRGDSHLWTLSFTNNSTTTPGSWTVSVKENGTELANGEIIFDGTGKPTTDHETLNVDFTPANGAPTQKVLLDFSGVSAYSSSLSTVRMASQDGVQAGFLTKVTLDADGYVVLTYSNAQTTKLARLALADFSDPNRLEKLGGSRFAATGDQRASFGAPGTAQFGKIKSGGIEASNVDLAQEFSELIVVQRGYQAASQVISAANDMLQQLNDIKGRR